MPAFYPEGDDPRIGDAPNRSLQKINSLLKNIDTKTGSTTITGPVTVSNEVEVTNSTGNPIPVSGIVALDSNSLAALENISVTFPATQNVNVTNAGLSVSVSNLPATQPVSLASVPSHPVTGPLTNTELRATAVPVSGTVTANTGLAQPLTDTQLRAVAVPVSGTVTVNDMTSGNAKTKIVDSTGTDVSYIPAGTAGTPSSSVLSVQGISGGTSLPVSGTVGIYPSQVGAGIQAYLDNYGNNIPVYDGASANVNDNLGYQGTGVASSDTGTFSVLAFIKRGMQNWTSLLAKIPALVSGRIPVDGSGVTQPISAASLPLPAGASTAAKQPALGTAGTPSSDVITVQGASAGTALNTKETQPIGDYVINVGSPGVISLSGSVVSTASFDAGATADYVVVTIEGGGPSGGLYIDGSTDNSAWTSGQYLNVYYDVPSISGTDAYSYRTVAGQLFGATRTNYNGRFIVSCAQGSAFTTANLAFRYFRITTPATYGSWRYKFASYKSPVYSIGGTNPGGVTRVNGRVDVGYVSNLPTLTATVTQATAANLNATVVGSGSFTAAQATASNLKAQAQLLDSTGSLLTYAATGTAGTPAADVVSVQGITSGVAIAVSGPVTDTQLRASSIPVSDRGSIGQATVTTFTSTSSLVLMASNSARKLLTVFNEGSGILYLLYGAGTASTANYSVRINSGDYLEIEKYTGAVTGIYGTAGTARVTEIS